MFLVYILYTPNGETDQWESGYFIRNMSFWKGSFSGKAVRCTNHEIIILSYYLFQRFPIIISALLINTTLNGKRSLSHKWLEQTCHQLHPWWWCLWSPRAHPGVTSTQPLLSLSASHTNYFHTLWSSSHMLGLTRSQIQAWYRLSWTSRHCPKSWQTPNAQQPFQMEKSYFPLAHPSACFPIQHNWAPMIS